MSLLPPDAVRHEWLPARLSGAPCRKMLRHCSAVDGLARRVALVSIQMPG